MMGARNGHIVPILPANDASLATGVIRHTGLDHLATAASGTRKLFPTRIAGISPL